MSEKYVKTTWENGVTKVNATNLNHIEQGIYNVTEYLNSTIYNNKMIGISLKMSSKVEDKIDYLMFIFDQSSFRSLFGLTNAIMPSLGINLENYVKIFNSLNSSSTSSDLLIKLYYALVETASDIYYSFWYIDDPEGGHFVEHTTRVFSNYKKTLYDIDPEPNFGLRFTRKTSETTEDTFSFVTYQILEYGNEAFKEINLDNLFDYFMLDQGDE